jgi:hypothetical protein
MNEIGFMNGFIGHAAIAGCILSTTAPLSVGTAQNSIHRKGTAFLANVLLAAYALVDAFSTERRLAPLTFKGSVIVAVTAHVTTSDSWAAVHFYRPSFARRFTKASRTFLNRSSAAFLSASPEVSG